MNTIVVCTDNSLSEDIARLCQRVLVKEACGLPIVSVSQKPIDFGDIRVVVGEIGRSWTSYYKQMLAACEAAPTDWIVMTEHDCLYTRWHLNYQPDDPGVFHYNSNCALLEGPGTNHHELLGMFSFWPRRLALSQLICRKDLLSASIQERLDILEKGANWEREFLGCGEPGVVSERALDKARRYASSGSSVRLEPYLSEYLTKYDHKVFRTDIPNIDIRHSSNFTGRKRGKHRTWSLPYWGSLSDILEIAA